jgi:cytochrome c553
MSSLTKPSLAAAFALACTLPVLAQQAGLPAPRFAPPNLTPKGVAALAADCAICHGPGGHPAPGSSVASLAGRPAREIVEAMAAFKGGQKPASVMHQISKGYSDAEIDAMARWFAARPR